MWCISSLELVRYILDIRKWTDWTHDNVLKDMQCQVKRQMAVEKFKKESTQAPDQALDKSSPSSKHCKELQPQEYNFKEKVVSHLARLLNKQARQGAR